MYTRILRSFAGAGSKGPPKLSALAQADCRSNPLGGGSCKAEQSRRPSNAPNMTKRGRHGPGIETAAPVDCDPPGPEIEVVSFCAPNHTHASLHFSKISGSKNGSSGW